MSSAKDVVKDTVNAMTLGLAGEVMNEEMEQDPVQEDENNDPPTAPVSDSKERERQSMRRRARRFAGRGRTGTVLSGSNNLG